MSPYPLSSSGIPIRLIRQVYAPPSVHTRWCLAGLQGHDRIQYVDYARNALWSALSAARVGPGDSVLLPDFICKDVLFAIERVGARPVYYPLERTLQVASGLELQPSAKVVIAVNYFGFAQDLAPFHAYCERTGALLIEDNAHGLFSRDSSGRLLGTRGDAGLFSFRKTLPVQNGAALTINDAVLASRLKLPVLAGPCATSWRWRLKTFVRKLVSLTGVRGLRGLIACGRALRDVLPRRTGDTSQPLNETGWRPGAPYADFVRDIARNDPLLEEARRRELYQWLHGYLRMVPCTPVFALLDAHTVPYGYPFHAEPEKLPLIRRHLARAGLDCFSWPDLPEDVAVSAPDWCKNIWCVQFLW